MPALNYKRWCIAQTSNIPQYTSRFRYYLLSMLVAKFWLPEKHQRNVDILFYSQCLEAWLDAKSLKVLILSSLHQILAWLKMYFVENMLNVDSELKYDFRTTTLGSDHMGGDWGRDISCPSHEHQQQNTLREGDIEFTVMIVDMSRRLDISRSECIGGFNSGVLSILPGWSFQDVSGPGFCQNDGGWYYDHHVTYAYDITSTSHHSLTARTQRDLWTHGPLVHISTHIYTYLHIYPYLRRYPVSSVTPCTHITLTDRVTITFAAAGYNRCININSIKPIQLWRPQ